MAKHTTVTQAAAESVQGAGVGGIRDNAVTTTPAVYTVTQWAGRYIEMVSEDQTAYYRFSDSSSATIDVSTEVTTAPDPAVGNDVPGVIFAGVPKNVVVPKFKDGKAAVYLVVRSKTGTTDFSAVPS